MAENNDIEVIKESLWYIDNYILIKDYYDRTISRIAARCIRKGNIAIEDYPFYPYIVDVLEELCETGDYIIEHSELHPYVEKKIQGGVAALKKNLQLYKEECEKNSTQEMMAKKDADLSAAKDAFSGFTDLASDPTRGAGQSIDEVVAKLVAEQEKLIEKKADEDE
ncbi:MAG: hypothetical protein J6W96_05170 [Alphaproteobacteria bacterium]|nr:hypothetical protein [Alphaproteobacteria bacterium]